MLTGMCLFSFFLTHSLRRQRPCLRRQRRHWLLAALARARTVGLPPPPVVPKVPSGPPPRSLLLLRRSNKRRRSLRGFRRSRNIRALSRCVERKPQPWRRMRKKKEPMPSFPDRLLLPRRPAAQHPRTDTPPTTKDDSRLHRSAHTLEVELPDLSTSFSRSELDLVQLVVDSSLSPEDAGTSPPRLSVEEETTTSLPSDEGSDDERSSGIRAVREGNDQRSGSSIGA